MAPLGGVKKSKRGKKTPLFTRMTSRRNAKKKPLLPKKGLTQTSYESGFFDFLKVFWKNNRSMEICNLTKQVAKAWESLLPKPKISKKQVHKDYSRELKILQEEEQRIRREKEKQKMIGRKENKFHKKTAGTDTDASSVADSEESSRSGRNTSDATEDESRSGKQSSYDGSTSGKLSTSQNDSESEFESDHNTYSKNRRQKRKRKGRKYASYEEYLKKRKTGQKTNQDGEKSNENNSDTKADQQGNSDQNPKDGVFFPIREETSFDRIVKNDYDNQEEMLRKLKLYGSNSDPNAQDNNDLRSSSSGNSQCSPLRGPKFPTPDRDTNPISPKLSNPTDTLHVKNLVLGIRQPELQEIFRVFMKDIVLIRVLDNKFNGEAVVEFKNVEAAERVWKQMNGVEYKRLPIVLEFANKEDLLY